MGSRGKKLVAMVTEETEDIVVANEKKQSVDKIMNLSDETGFEASLSEMDVIFADDRTRTQNFDIMTNPIVFEQNQIVENTTFEESTSSEIQIEFEDLAPVTNTVVLEYYNLPTVDMCEQLSNQLEHREPDIDEVNATTIIAELQPVQNDVMISCENDMEVAQTMSTNCTTIMGQEDRNLEDGSGAEITEQIRNSTHSVHSNSGKIVNGEKGVLKKKKLRKDKQSSANNRVLGLGYIGYKKVDNSIIQDEPKQSRKVRNRCGHNNNKKKSERTFLCSLISEKSRKDLFNYFWKLPTWPEKKMYIKGLVSTRKVRKRRPRRVGAKEMNTNVSTEETEDDTEEEKELQRRPKKMEGHDIFLPTESGEKVRVCRIFFLNTFCLGEDTFKRWVKRETDKADAVEVQICQPPRKRKKIEDEQSIKSWLDLLPKVPSHYCRQSSKKLYVESVFSSKAHMHREYEKWCLERQIKPASITLLKKIMKDESIAIHRPRKDQCDTCCSHKLGYIPDEEYQTHIQRKNEARDEKNVAKASAIANNDHIAITMDLQSVLLCPKTLQSAMYYKTKLQVHNFTIYNLKNGDVTLYVWHEGNGGVTSNEFTTCILDFLYNAINEYKIMTLISDGCGYQNRNRVLSSALRDFAVQHNVTIEQIYLTKGHTMMEADSVHSTLEQLFYPPINSPSDYVAKMRSARPKQPYDVKVIHFDFFKKYETLPTNLVSLRPGKSVGDPVVTDLCKIKYGPDGIIWYKTNFKENWLELSQRRQSTTERRSVAQLYDKPLPISESKFRDLQSLKSAIEKEHHVFYDNLSFKPDKKTKDKKLSSKNAAENPQEKLENKKNVLKKQPGKKTPTEKPQINVQLKKSKQNMNKTNNKQTKPNNNKKQTNKRNKKQQTQTANN